MLRFHSGFYAAVILLLLAIALPAQAAINFLEDFEGGPIPPRTIDALGWGQNGGSVLSVSYTHLTLPTILLV